MKNTLKPRQQMAALNHSKQIGTLDFLTEALLQIKVCTEMMPTFRASFCLHLLGIYTLLRLITLCWGRTEIFCDYYMKHLSISPLC